MIENRPAAGGPPARVSGTCYPSIAVPGGLCPGSGPCSFCRRDSSASTKRRSSWAARESSVLVLRSMALRSQTRSRVGTNGHRRNDWNTLPEGVMPTVMSGGDLGTGAACVCCHGRGSSRVPRRLPAQPRVQVRYPFQRPESRALPPFWKIVPASSSPAPARDETARA